MTDTSSTDPLVASGLDPKIAAALDKHIEKAVGKAVQSLGIAAQSRPQEAVQLPASKERIGRTDIIAIAAVVSILGAIYWLNNNMRAGFESVSEEFGRVRDEISDLRNHTLAEIGSVRAEIGLAPKSASG